MKTRFAALGDAELAVEYSQGNKGAFGEIYERYWFKLYLHARKMLKDDRLAEDVVQEVFTMLLEKLGTLQLVDTLSSYLYRSVSNRILNMIRHEKVKGSYLEDLKHYAPVAYQPSDARVLEKELAAIIDREIARLSPKVREVFEMSRRENLSHREIAQRTGSSEATVTKQIYFALKILRGKLRIVSTVSLVNVILWLSRNH